MAKLVKKIFAVTNIKGSEATWINQGSDVDPKQFTKEELTQLYDAGALEIREVEEVEPEPAKSEWFDKVGTETEVPDTSVEGAETETNEKTETDEKTETNEEENPPLPNPSATRKPSTGRK